MPTGTATTYPQHHNSLNSCLREPAQICPAHRTRICQLPQLEVGLRSPSIGSELRVRTRHFADDGDTMDGLLPQVSRQGCSSSLPGAIRNRRLGRFGVRFGVLGPIEVRQEGRLLDIGRGRERIVLAVLLLNVDRLTLTTRLIDVLWREPPHSAKAQLHNLISSLRRRLDVGVGDLIVSRPGGYGLDLGNHELDLREFRQLAERGREFSGSGHPRLAQRCWPKPCRYGVDPHWPTSPTSSLRRCGRRCMRNNSQRPRPCWKPSWRWGAMTKSCVSSPRASLITRTGNGCTRSR
jgi:hypothetical protein